MTADEKENMKGDDRALNGRTTPDRYPVRHIHDFSYQLSGCTIFSKIYLIKAYNQIPVNPEDNMKTAIAINFGLFEFAFMTFGLRNAAQLFQRFRDEVLHGLVDFIYGYYDDILIVASTEDHHKNHLQQVLERLTYYGVLITSKCVLGKPELSFLGYKIFASGTRTLENKVQVYLDYPVPRTVTIKKVLRIAKFYRRFVPEATK